MDVFGLLQWVERTSADTVKTCICICLIWQHYSEAFLCCIHASGRLVNKELKPVAATDETTNLQSPLVSSSSHPGAGGAGHLGRENLEDHRLWLGQRVAPDHQDECSWDVRLDGPRGHQAVPLLQKQRRVEVKPPSHGNICS